MKNINEKHYNSNWEDKNLSNDVFSIRKEVLSNMDLPNCLSSISCRYCGSKGDLSSVQSISLMLNTKSIKDIAIEYSCLKCSRMYRFFLEGMVENIEDFISFLKGYSDETFLEKVDVSITESQLFCSDKNNLINNYM